MGINILGSSSDREVMERMAARQRGEPVDFGQNPDPDKWEIIQSYEMGGLLLLRLRYPNCTNREGEKIMVFKCFLQDLINQGSIDPHFGEGDLIYPIARFQPNEEGWNDALRYMSVKGQFDLELVLTYSSGARYWK